MPSTKNVHKNYNKIQATGLGLKVQQLLEFLENGVYAQQPLVHIHVPDEDRTLLTRLPPKYHDVVCRVFGYSNPNIDNDEFETILLEHFSQATENDFSDNVSVSSLVVYEDPETISTQQTERLQEIMKPVNHLMVRDVYEEADSTMLANIFVNVKALIYENDTDE